MRIYIRNMACESCKEYVKACVIKLKLQPVKVELGEVVIKGKLSATEKSKLNKMLKKVGLSIAESHLGIIVEKIKGAIYSYVEAEGKIKTKFSSYLSEQLKLEYNYISSLFSEMEANTISNFLTSLKMEKAKEMIIFEDVNMTDVAKRLYYSSPSHFSYQFKRTTGFPPSHFKQLKEKRRQTVQQLLS